MNGMEVHTAAEYGIPVVFVVFNNSGLGMVEQGDRMVFGRPVCPHRYTRPIDAYTVAKGLGATAFRARTADELEQALRDALLVQGPSVIDVEIDPREIPPALRLRAETLKRLSPRAMVYPVQCEFTNFVAAVLAAWEAVLAGHCRTALVLCGTAWTRNMDYANPHALTVGDGAGAVVVGRGGTLRLLDYASETDSSEYGVMTMAYRATPPIQPLAAGDGASRCTYHIAEEGIAAFLRTGMETPPRVVCRLLAAHGLRGEDVALITHQASRRLMDHWRAAIGTAEYPDTFDSLGNMGLCSVPVTLSLQKDRLRSNHLVLVQLGVGGQVCALLLRAGSSLDPRLPQFL